MANCEQFNAVSMIQKYGLVSTEEEAMAEVSNLVARSSTRLMESTKRALADPTLSSGVKRWMTALPYVASGAACKSMFCTIVCTANTIWVLL